MQRWVGRDGCMGPECRMLHVLLGLLHGVHVRCSHARMFIHIKVPLCSDVVCMYNLAESDDIHIPYMHTFITCTLNLKTHLYRQNRNAIVRHRCFIQRTSCQHEPAVCMLRRCRGFTPSRQNACFQGCMPAEAGLQVQRRQSMC